MKKETMKKVAGALLFKPAITSRNLTSLALVAIFFGVYIAAGGKVTTIPNVKPGEDFGSVRGVESAVEEIEELEEELDTATENSPRKLFDDSKSARPRAVGAVSSAEPSGKGSETLTDLEQKLKALKKRQER